MLTYRHEFTRISLSLILFCLCVGTAFAVPCGVLHAGLLQDVARTNAPLKINQVDEADRRTAKDYAAEHNATEDEIKRRYAATGDLICGHFKSQANVTLASDLITTSAHSLVADGKCVDPTKTYKCTFTVEIEGQRIDYETSKLLDSGWICNYPDITSAGTDWAVLRLNKKVDPRVKPYAIDPTLRLRMHFNTKLVAVGKSFDFPMAKPDDVFQHPRHYGDCQTKQPVGSAIQTNCDLSAGASGGALVTPGPDPILVGVHEREIIGGTLGRDKCPKPNWSKRVGSYSMCWATASVLVTTDLAEAVRKAAKESERAQ